MGVKGGFHSIRLQLAGVRDANAPWWVHLQSNVDRGPLNGCLYITGETAGLGQQLLQLQLLRRPLGGGLQHRIPDDLTPHLLHYEVVHGSASSTWPCCWAVCYRLHCRHGAIACPQASYLTA
jgi:hypothetical protein